MTGPSIITLSLPYPPSANRIWRNVAGKTLKSRAYRSWLESVRGEVLIARCGQIAGPYRLEVRANRPDRRARDIDNLLKPTSDALMAAGVIGDDSAAVSVFAEWAEPIIKGGRLDVTVIAT
jgi:crossover junction endodeoxyribonuclease RusA